MEGYDWLELFPSGFIRVNVAEDEWVDLRRAKVGDIRKFGLMLEDADDVMRNVEKRIRDKVGFTDQQSKWLEELQNIQEGQTPSGEALMNAPDINELQARYISELRRFLYGAGDEPNPYPAIWRELLSDMGDFEIEIDDMPPGMLAQTAISEVIVHFQNAPLVRGTQPDPTSPLPSRSERRSGGKS